MPGRGPVPKPPEKRVRRNATIAMHEIPRGSRVARAPKLPPPMDGRRVTDGGVPFDPEVHSADTQTKADWLAGTKTWYRRWARSEQATQFTSVMWGRLHDMAYLVDNFYRSPTADKFTEIRLNEAKLGATPEDMQRLRWRVVDPKEDDEDGGRRRSRSGRDPRHLAAVPDAT